MKSIVLFGVALASATTVIIFGLTATNHLNVPAFLQEGISMITTGEKCAKNGEWASIADEDGFAAVKPFHGAPQLKAKTETPDRKPGLYEFVLASNSTGYITMVYDSCGNQENVDIRNNISKFFEAFDTRKNGISKFDSNDKSESYQAGQAIWLPANDTGGVSVYPSEIKQENDHRFIVTYAIEADANAQKGLYIMNLYHTCPGELLTIGEGPHQGEIPWANGTFYGCSF